MMPRMDDNLLARLLRRLKVTQASEVSVSFASGAGAWSAEVGSKVDMIDEDEARGLVGAGATPDEAARTKLG